MGEKDKPIGVFDSGVGGVSVLQALVRHLPRERFLYYADTANAPYGTKTKAQVAELSLRIADFLVVEKGAKALVVACNTATSAAVKLLRERFPVPIIGMEPALKPAVAQANGKAVLVMATPMTLREEKFQALLARYGQGAGIISLPCPGLVELIEAGETEGERIGSFLRHMFASVETERVGVVVLGCTHYIFARKAIAGFFPEDTLVIDGNEGTAKQLKRVLQLHGLERPGLAPVKQEPVQWFTSGGPQDLEKLRAFWRK